MIAAQPGLLVAAGAGALSFASPCTLPLYPAYLLLLSGESVRDARGARSRLRLLAHAAAFLAGFAVLFLALGLSASLAGRAFLEWRGWLERLGGVAVLLLGLSMLGVLPRGPLLRQWGGTAAPRSGGYLAAALAGLGLAAGWTPCVGPILASVLVLAAAAPRTGLLLVGAYLVGFAVPFLALAAGAGFTRGLGRRLRWVEPASGVLLLSLGTLLVTGWFAQLSALAAGL